MPRLPSVENLGARPVPINRQGIAVQDTTAAGRGLASIAPVIAQIGEEYQQREDEQKVLEYRRALIEFDKTKVHDPESGAAAKLGKDALDLPKTLPAEFDEYASKAAKGLTSNRQRQIAAEMAAGRRESISSWANSHAGQQRKVYDSGEYAANNSAAKDNATLYPTLATQELAGMAKATEEYGKRNGMGPEAIAAKIKADASDVHAAIVTGMVKDGNVGGAEEYFKANASAMDSAARDRAQSSLKEVGARSKAQAFEDDVTARGLSAEDALKEAKEKFKGDPYAREIVVHQVKTLYAEKEAVRTQAVKQVSTDAWSMVMAGGLRSIPADKMATLRRVAPEEERQMRDWEEAKWRRAKADAEGKKEEDWGMYMMLRDMALQDPAKFNDPQTLLKAEPYLSKSQMSTLVNTRNSISKDDIKGMESQRTVKRTVDLVKQEILNAGIDLTPKEGSTKAKDTAQFFGTLTQRLDAAIAEKGKPLTDAEAKQIGMSMLRENVEQGSGFFGIGQTKKRGYQIPAEDADKFVSTPYEKIPKALRDEIEADLKKRDGPPGIYGNAAKHEAEVERIYQRAVNAGAVK